MCPLFEKIVEILLPPTHTLNAGTATVPLGVGQRTEQLIQKSGRLRSRAAGSRRQKDKPLLPVI